MKLAEFKAANPDLFFNPVTYPIYANDQEIPTRKAIFREDTNKFLSVVSNDYVVVPNVAIAEQFVRVAEAANIEYQFKSGYGIRNGVKTSFLVDFPTRKIMADAGDVSFLRGSLGNGFDGLFSAILDMGFFRLSCSNGAGVYTKETSMKFRHIGDVDTKIVDGFKGYIEDSTGAVQLFVTNLTQHAFANKESVVSIIDNALWLPKKYREQVATEWAIDNSLSGWQLWNAFTKVITHSIQSAEVRNEAYKALSRNATRKWLSLDVEDATLIS